MSPTHLSRIEAGIRSVVEFSEAFDRRDVDGMMRLMSDDCVVEDTCRGPDGDAYAGREAVTRFWRDLFLVSPQCRFAVEEVFGLGQRCAMRWRREWTGAGGEKERLRGAYLFKFRGGYICEILAYVKY